MRRLIADNKITMEQLVNDIASGKINDINDDFILVLESYVSHCKEFGVGIHQVKTIRNLNYMLNDLFRCIDEMIINVDSLDAIMISIVKEYVDEDINVGEYCSWERKLYHAIIENPQVKPKVEQTLKEIKTLIK